MSNRRVGIASRVTAALLATLAAPVACAVTFTVNSTLDQPDDLTMPGVCHTAAGTCTLRAAVMAANRTSGVGATVLVPPGTYALTIPATAGNGDSDGDLNLTTPVSGSPLITITGAGAGVTIIDGNQLDRVFTVAERRQATITGLTIRNGFYRNVSKGNKVGAAGIDNGGSLILDKVTITANHAANSSGGGIGNSGTLTVMNSTIDQNRADNDGGGIYNLGTLTLIDSVVSLNHADDYGGGIANDLSAILIATGSTIHGNVADTGGGVGNSASMTVSNSTISQNNANGNGGGLYNQGSVLVYSTSILFNGADADADPAGGAGGGVYNEPLASGNTVNLHNSLVAGNSVHNAPVYDDCRGKINSVGRNLFWMVPDCTISGGNGSFGFLASLTTIGPLQDNGGPTPTHALLQGSTAIDADDPALGCTGPDAKPLTTDQRGAPRPVNGRCDIGAFEYSALPSTAVAIEYHHADFDHYFVTAIADEITKLDNGTFAGWTRTGQSFKVYPSSAFGLAGVCRFFSTAFAPKSSHFYTPNANECAIVKANHDWQFEAVVFYMANTDEAGNCASNTQSVYRLYNNGQGGAPNHRYTTSLTVRAQMLAQGWIPEGTGTLGVIMCAPL